MLTMMMALMMMMMMMMMMMLMMMLMMLMMKMMVMVMMMMMSTSYHRHTITININIRSLIFAIIIAIVVENTFNFATLAQAVQSCLGCIWRLCRVMAIKRQAFQATPQARPLECLAIWTSTTAAPRAKYGASPIGEGPQHCVKAGLMANVKTQLAVAG